MVVAWFVRGALLSPTLLEGEGVVMRAWQLAGMAGSIAAFHLALGLLPFGARSGFRSDGAQLLALARTAYDPTMLAPAVLQLEAAASLRARDWSVSVEDAVRAADCARRDAGWLRLLAFARAVDGPHREGAVSILEPLLAPEASDPDFVRREAHLQRSLLAALLENDPRTARRHLVEAGVPGPKPAYPKLAEAAVLLAEGRQQEAARAVETWDAAVRESDDPAAVLVGNHWARDIVAERLRS
jgi:hypothetical protein